MFYFITFVSFFLFFLLTKKFFLKLNLNKFLIVFLAVLWWITWWSVILKIVNNFWLDSLKFYSVIWAPIFEELVKFLIIYLLVDSFIDYYKNYRFWLIIWGIVWLSFSVFENVVYFKLGLDSIILLTYRIFFVGLLVHTLTWMIYGYILSLRYDLYKKFPYVFKKYKKDFLKLHHLWHLTKFVYKKAWRKKKTLLWFFLKIFTLDITLKYIFSDKIKESTWWHGPVELVFESLVLWIWIHIFYNLILTFVSWETNLILYVLFWILLIWCYKLINKILWNFVLTIIVLILLNLPLLKNFLIGNVKLLDRSVDLVFVIFLLVYIMIYLDKKVS